MSLHDAEGNYYAGRGTRRGAGTSARGNNGVEVEKSGEEGFCKALDFGRTPLQQDLRNNSNAYTEGRAGVPVQPRAWYSNNDPTVPIVWERTQREVSDTVQ